MLRVYKKFFISSIFFLLSVSYVSVANSTNQKISEQDLASLSTHELMYCVQLLEKEPEQEAFIDPTVGAPLLVCCVVSVWFGLQELWDRCATSCGAVDDEQFED
ncbi:hypothetical protein K2W90_04195 [Candidatus Babeliales bacterium]|nr:hypothetical protein [Candidatus Babeliales bacterium]